MTKRFFVAAVFTLLICFPFSSMALQGTDASAEIIDALKARIENLEKSLQETKQQLESFVETRKKVDQLEADQKEIKQVALAQESAAEKKTRASRSAARCVFSTT